MTADAGQADFFISRAGADTAIAAQIGQILEAAGYSVILQDWDFANRNFMEAMHAALESGARVIALISPEYLKSEHCIAEALNAIGHDPLNKRGRLIVMRAGECTPGGLFTALAYWDLLPLRGNVALLREAVLAAVSKERRKTAVDAAAAYWRAPRTVLHGRIRAVPNFTGRREDLEALGKALWGDKGGAETPLTPSPSPARGEGSPAVPVERAFPSSLAGEGTGVRGTSTAIRPVAITQAAVQGLGGVGKSTLAIQYAWENRERYAGAWWLGADSPAGIVDGLVALGAQFNPALNEVQDRAEAARWALSFLAEGGFEKPWLLIYDNAPQPKALDGLLPRAGAHMLVTTRWPDWQGRAAAVPLGVFAPDEAVAFLLARTGRTDAQGAAALARDLGHLPLALDHAAAYCRRTGVAFETYRALLPDLIKRAPKDADYSADVYATFSLAIERAAADCAEAEKLTGLLAWFAPDDIPLDVIGAEAMSELERGEAVAALHEVSLLDLKSGGDGKPTVSVHPLVQMVMRGRLAAQGKAEEAAALALAFVADAFPYDSDDVRFWPACAALRPHAFSVLETAPDTGEMAEKTSRLLNQLALYLNIRAEYTEAEPLMRLALVLSERSFGPGHPKVAIRLNNLAQLLQATNRLAEAEPLMRRALAIDEESFGPGHPKLAIRLNNLAQLLQATNRLAEAEPLMRRALAIDEESFGPGHPNVAIDLNNLAALLQATNRLAEAEPLMRRALAIDEKSFGPSHPKVAIRLNNLAQLLQDTNRLAEAEPSMRRALAIDEESFGPGHPNVAIDLNNLATLLADTNRLAEAEPLMRRALAIDEKSFGPSHPKVAIRLNNLALLLQDTNRLAEAEPLMRRTLAIDEESFGPGHPKVARDLNNLAQLLQDTNRLAEAEPLMRHALAIDEQSFGPGHPKVARDLNNLAQLLQATNQLAEAEPLMRRAVEILTAKFLASIIPTPKRASRIIASLQPRSRAWMWRRRGRNCRAGASRPGAGGCSRGCSGGGDGNLMPTAKCLDRPPSSSGALCRRPEATAQNGSGFRSGLKKRSFRVRAYYA